MKKNTFLLKSRNIKNLIFFVLLGVFAVLFIYYLMIKLKLKDTKFLIDNQKTFLEQIQKEREKYQGDNYGAENPLGTYQMFLEALKQGNIDLAIKYFSPDVQDKYKILFSQIKEKGQWEKMMKDLLREENQKGEYITEDWYNIKIKNEKNEVITTVVLKIIKDFNNQPVSKLWKIVEF